MRRSSSVPCKRVTVERGSTSSSDDSGFSPGSPNTSAMLNGFTLEQAMRGMNLIGEDKIGLSNVPNDNVSQNETELQDSSEAASKLPDK